MVECLHKDTEQGCWKVLVEVVWELHNWDHFHHWYSNTVELRHKGNQLGLLVLE